MAIQFTCPSCNQLVTVSEQHAGGQVYCPTCRAQLSVPRAGERSQMLQGGVVGPQPAAPSASPPAPSYGPTPAAAGPQVLVAPPKRCGMATASFIMSLCSWLCCLGPLMSIPGFLLGLAARGKIKRGGGTLTGSGVATGGWLISLLNLLLVGALVITWFSVPNIRHFAVTEFRMAFLGQAITEYTWANGATPSDLQALVGRSPFVDEDTLLCPYDDQPFVYTAADTPTGSLAHGTILMYSSKGMAPGQRFVLMWPNQIVPMDVSTLQAELRAQGVPEELIP